MSARGEVIPSGERRSSLRIAHHHPGRLRVRAELFASDRNAVERTRAAVVAMGGVQDITHDPRTGSFLIHYDPNVIDVSSVIDRIKDKANLELEQVEPDGTNLIAHRIIDAVRGLDAITAEATGGRFGVGGLISGGLAALGIYSFAKGPHERMPRWDSLIYWAYSVFIHAHVSATRSPS